MPLHVLDDDNRVIDKFSNGHGQPALGQWVWTTFYDFQWDLNYANPVVFTRMLEEMLVTGHPAETEHDDASPSDGVPVWGLIVGIVAADAGRIEIDGTPITAMPMHKRARLGLSYLPQDASVFRRLTVEENIRAVLELQLDDNGRSISKNDINERLETLISELQIAHIRQNTALSLSGGERRRVEIARALASNPRFILLDEPFAGVDPIAVIEIQRIVQFLKGRNIGVLITDHNVRETLGICDRAYIISEGTVLTSGHPSEIIDNEAVRKVYLGSNFRM